MSYFLEDTVRTDSTVIVDYTGMNESMFNAEMAWSNIMESAMKTEYMAIRNESQTILQEGISDFFEKVKQWFKDMFNSITRVIANIKNKIILKLKIYEKYAVKAATKLKSLHADKIDKINERLTNNKKDIKIVDIDSLQPIYNKLFQVTDKYNTVNDKESAKDFLVELNKSYAEYKKAIEKLKTSTITLNDFKAGLRYAYNAIDELKASTKDINDILKGFDVAKKDCQIGIRYADKEDKDGVLKNKSQITVINRCKSIHLNGMMTYYSILKSNISKIVSLVGDSSENSLDKKYSKAMEKDNNNVNASYYGF